MKAHLRKYQKDCLVIVENEFKKHKKRLCVLPTGSGKTLIFCHLIKRLNLKTLVVSHTREIINQTHKMMNKEFPEVSCAIFEPRKKNNEEVIISSIQSSVKPLTMEKLKKQNFKLLVIDECHRSCAKSYRKLINHLGFEDKKMIGFTATPFRSDMQSVTKIFGFSSFRT